MSSEPSSSTSHDSPTKNPKRRRGGKISFPASSCYSCYDSNCPEARSIKRRTAMDYYTYPQSSIHEMNINNNNINNDNINITRCPTGTDQGIDEQRDNCCDAIHCMDEECQRLMEEYCQACLDHDQICDVDGCQGTAHCDQCCDESHCTEQCSTSGEEVCPFQIRD